MNKRFEFIDCLILQIYKDLNELRYPFDTTCLTTIFKNVRFLSYTQLANQSGENIQTIIEANYSSTGTSYYDKENDRYICMYNDTPDIPLSRQLWTKAHEFGHVVLGHHQMIGGNLSTEPISNTLYRKLEKEANYFASQLIAPYSIFAPLKINSPSSAQKKFGLSTIAALTHYKGFLEFKSQPMNPAQQELQQVACKKLGIKMRKRRNGK